MDTKEYPKAELRRIKTSTSLICAGCRQAIPLYEDCWEELGSGGLAVHYHNRCKSSQDNPVVKTIKVEDSLSVKSQGK